MYRSGSTNRVSDEQYLNYYNSNNNNNSAPLSLEAGINHELPMYEPVLSEVAAAKKDREKEKEKGGRLKFAEINPVHLIPFVLLLCAVILWFFSNPGTTYPYIY